jgi:hypothetical protein
MSGMIFSLFEPTFRMASIEVLDYRKDGEVEARRVTGANITERWPISPTGAAEVRSPPRLPSSGGDESQPILGRWAELIRRQFNLLQPDRGQRSGCGPDRRPQPDREQRYRGHGCYSAQPNSRLPFRSIAR